MLRFLVRVLINGVAIWLTTLMFSGVAIVVGDKAPETSQQWLNTVLVLAVISAVFTLVQMVVKPIVQILSIPFYIITLGLFHLVVNALMLLLTSWLTSFTSFGLTVEGWWTAVLAAVVISIVSVLLSMLVLPKPTTER